MLQLLSRRPVTSPEEVPDGMLTFSYHDAIEYLGFTAQAVNGAIRSSLREIPFKRELLNRCKHTHALVFVRGTHDEFVWSVNRKHERLMLPRRGKRSGFNFRFDSVDPGYYLVRLKSHPDTHRCNLMAQEYHIGHVQSGESVARAYVAAFAALALHGKYGLAVVDTGEAARTSDIVGRNPAVLIARGNGRFAIEVWPDDDVENVGALSMIVPS